MEKQVDLKDLVERYCNLKSDVDSYKKQIEQDNKNIKEIMKDTGISAFKSDNYEVKYSVSKSDSFDEDLLILKLDALYPEFHKLLIKEKPYVDMEALEDAIYKGLVDASELASCRVHKETPKLTFKRLKNEN